MTPTLLDLALKAGFSDPIEGWMGEAYEERLEAFAKSIIEHEAAKWHPYGSLDEVTRDLRTEVEASNRMHAELLRLKNEAWDKGVCPICNSKDEPQPADEPVAFDDWPEYHEQGMGCGLEDRGITDRYEAMRYGWDEALERAWESVNLFGPLYTRPQPAALWVGLEEDEINKLRHLVDWTAEWSYGRFAYELEQLLREKNGGAA